MCNYDIKSMRGWYHNGGDSVDSPEVVFWPHLAGEPYGFPDGPFETFTEAKKALVDFHSVMAASHNLAMRRTKRLTQPVKEGETDV